MDSDVSDILLEGEAAGGLNVGGDENINVQNNTTPVPHLTIG